VITTAINEIPREFPTKISLYFIQRLGTVDGAAYPRLDSLVLILSDAYWHLNPHVFLDYDTTL
jgi:hypothetical protein